ncbi:MAG TPA: aminotransferase class III-fold pyridoxal phosphate-dependent enzyme [Saprospiraceae bacterium]|nr:aminotransferase class III-fold pyridoxal phosphate-dependent enzyme [Saprospiraceae bacterium]HUN16250.1 aminotransferase class III-fold pyridoxal phosphate-dependent enzyme [Saprospiraceae bacterium]
MSLFPVYSIKDIEIVSAKGMHVYDKNGQEYLDLYGGHAVISIGHTHPEYVSNLTSQLNKIGFYSNSIKIPLQNELADKICSISGKKDYQLFLCNSGAEANENAMKLASFYNARKKIIAFTNAFHGRTSLAVAATDNPSIVAPVNETENIVFLPFNNMEALKEYFLQYGKEVSSVIVEGIQGVGGIREASPLFLKTIRELCTAYNAIYIADSVQCGCGRSGKYFSHDYAEVDADIYTMAKGIGNGFPIGAILISPSIHAKLGMLGTTFGGNHLACVAAITVIDVMTKENLIANANLMGNYFVQELKQFPQLKNVRGKGLMLGFDTDEVPQLKNILLDKYHIFVGEAKPNVIRLLPALTITKKEIDYFISILKQELNS